MTLIWSNDVALMVVVSLLFGVVGLVYFVRISSSEKKTAPQLTQEEKQAKANGVEFAIGASVCTSYGQATIVSQNSPTSFTVQLENGEEKLVSLQEITPITVQDLFIYPVKSCHGIRVEEAQITKRGFKYDRMWMIVDKKGRFFTQRKNAKMALIQPVLPSTLQDIEHITLTAEGMDDIKVPIVASSEFQSDVVVWKSKVVAIDQGDLVAKWLQEFLNSEGLRLVMMNNDSVRFTSPEAEFQTGFSDGFPYLIACDSSIQKLNTKLSSPISINQFRANIVASGCPPFSDDQWSSISVGKYTMRNVKPCDRCKMPTIDQETGLIPTANQPTDALMSFRSGASLGLEKKHQNSVFFGSNLVCFENEGVLKVGDQVRVLTLKKW